MFCIIFIYHYIAFYIFTYTVSWSKQLSETYFAEIIVYFSNEDMEAKKVRWFIPSHIVNNTWQRWNLIQYFSP